MAFIAMGQRLIIINQLLIVMRLIAKNGITFLVVVYVLKLAHKIINAVGALVLMEKTNMALVLLVLINILLVLLGHFLTVLILMAPALVALLAMELARTGNASTDLKSTLDVIIQQIAILRLKGVYI